MACVTARILRSPPEQSARQAGHGSDTHSDPHLARKWKGQCEVTEAGIKIIFLLSTGALDMVLLKAPKKRTDRAPNRTDFPTTTQGHSPPLTPRRPVGVQPDSLQGQSGVKITLGAQQPCKERRFTGPLLAAGLNGRGGSRKERPLLQTQSPECGCSHPGGKRRQTGTQSPDHPRGEGSGAAQAGANGLHGAPLVPTLSHLHAGPTVAQLHSAGAGGPGQVRRHGDTQPPYLRSWLAAQSV